MILSCPACASCYHVEENSLKGDGGRPVRCSLCGHIWRAYAKAYVTKEYVESAPRPQNDLQDEPAPSSNTLVGVIEEADIPAFIPSEQEIQAPLRQRPVSRSTIDPFRFVVRWGIAISSMIFLVAILLVCRTQVVRWCPVLASVYDFIGLDASDARNMHFQNGMWTKGMTPEGHLITMFSGQIVNMSLQMQTMPKGRLVFKGPGVCRAMTKISNMFGTEIQDKDCPLLTLPFKISDEKVLPTEIVPFTLQLTQDVPKGATGVSLELE